MRHLALLLDDFEVNIVNPSSSGFSWFSLIISGSGEEEVSQSATRLKLVEIL